MFTSNFEWRSSTSASISYIRLTACCLRLCCRTMASQFPSEESSRTRSYSSDQRSKKPTSSSCYDGIIASLAAASLGTASLVAAQWAATAASFIGCCVIGCYGCIIGCCFIGCCIIGYCNVASDTFDRWSGRSGVSFVTDLSS